MKYLSVCSGIEAATAAWHELGWEPVAFSEIEKFPSAVLAHHYPDVPNWGDMTKFKEWPDADVDVLVGGTPCQSFSVAGLREGLADPRGNLMLTYLAIAERYRPEWLVWENVPGVLSSSEGRDFSALISGMVELGYCPTWRVLDAQYFGVAQRRRRVFVVGHLGDWRRAAAVLLERESLRGDSAPRREAREVAPTIPSRSTGGGGLGTDFDCDGGLVCMASGQGGAEVAENLSPTLNCNRDGSPILAVCATGFHARQEPISELELSLPLEAKGGQAVCVTGDKTHALTAEGHDASEDGTWRGTPVVAFAQNQRDELRTMEVAGALAAEPGMKQQTYVAYEQQGRRIQGDGGVAPTVMSNPAGGMKLEPVFDTGRNVVRRLTPVECERLQGFPDNFTRIPWRGKPADKCPDGPRYKALGNSMAVPVMNWIGRRIMEVA